MKNNTYAYGLDEESSDWWNKHVTFRWSPAHSDSVTLWFSGLFDVLMMRNNIKDKDIVLTFNRHVINTIYPFFEGDDYLFFEFMRSCGDEIIKFLNSPVLYSKTYERDTINRFVVTNGYYKFGTMSEILRDYPFSKIDDLQISNWCNTVIQENPGVVSDFKNGKLPALNRLKGLVMKLSKGSADPTVVSNILTSALI
jgi:hypothetical protein